MTEASHTCRPLHCDPELLLRARSGLCRRVGGQGGHLAHQVFASEDEAGSSWHRYPEIRPGCHVHVGPRQGASRVLYRPHVPSGRVALEEVFRFLIADWHFNRRHDRAWMSEEVVTDLTATLNLRDRRENGPRWRLVA